MGRFPLTRINQFQTNGEIATIDARECIRKNSIQ